MLESMAYLGNDSRQSLLWNHIWVTLILISNQVWVPFIVNLSKPDVWRNVKGVCCDILMELGLILMKWGVGELKRKKLKILWYLSPTKSPTDVSPTSPSPKNWPISLTPQMLPLMALSLYKEKKTRKKKYKETKKEKRSMLWKSQRGIRR